MSDPSSGKSYEQARELTEQALDKLVNGQDQEADQLIERAKQVDPAAVEEVVRDMDEDAETRSPKG